MIQGMLRVTDRRVERLDALDAMGIPESGFVWIDVAGQTHEDLAYLGERFHLHPLALEDCEHLDQRPKLEEYDGHLFLVIQGFTPPISPESASTDDVNLHEIHIFFSQRFVLTVHMNPHPGIDRLWAQLQEEPELGGRGPEFILYRICDGVVDANFPTLEGLSRTLEVLEDEVLSNNLLDPVPRFLSMKRSFSDMRRVLSPQREVFAQLLRRDDAFLSSQTRLYFRDVYDHLVRLTELVEVERELLASARDAHFTMLSQRTNEIMKRLTMASIVFLPLTVITGFFGMNFTHMPFDNDMLLVTMLLSMLSIPIAMLVWFQRRRWL